MSLDRTRVIVMESLAAKTGRDLAELTTELQAAGAEYPYDSAWLVSAGARAARLMGLTLKNARQHARAFKSVEALATYLNELDEQQRAA
jgi:hypothetical protein